MLLTDYNPKKHIELERKEAREEAREEAIDILVQSLQEVGINRDRVTTKIMEKFQLTREQAEGYIETFWK